MRAPAVAKLSTGWVLEKDLRIFCSVGNATAGCAPNTSVTKKGVIFFPPRKNSMGKKETFSPSEIDPPRLWCLVGWDFAGHLEVSYRRFFENGWTHLELRCPPKKRKSGKGPSCVCLCRKTSGVSKYFQVFCAFGVKIDVMTHSPKQSNFLPQATGRGIISM